jgi:hypothetical protein
MKTSIINGSEVSRLSVAIQQNMKTSIINGSEVSRLSVAIQIIIGRDSSMPGGYKIITGYPTP